MVICFILRFSSARWSLLWGENLSKISLPDLTCQKIPFTQTFLYLSKVPFVPIQADHCLVGYLRGNLPVGAKFLRPAHLELPRREDTPLVTRVRGTRADRGRTRSRAMVIGITR